MLVKSLVKLPEGKRLPNMYVVAVAMVDSATLQKQKQIMIRNKNTYDFYVNGRLKQNFKVLIFVTHCKYLESN